MNLDSKYETNFCIIKIKPKSEDQPLVLLSGQKPSFVSSLVRHQSLPVLFFHIQVSFLVVLMLT